MTTKYLGDGIWARRTSLEDAEIMMPSDLQNRHSETIQVITASTVTAGNSATSSWYDCDGFSAIGITLASDAPKESSIIIQWSNDGTNLHGEETLASGNSQYKPAHTNKVADYVRLKVINGDTASHVMNAWLNLQV
ncbi:hypothetical protein V7094_25920 [Priestia megaterium]|uniref:hypothetical protein n=1 Tax=Priestia megaterium TaxID=1404 RepID=UPI0030005770